MVVKTHLSFTDPVREQEDRCSLDQENEHFQGSGLNKSYFKSYQLKIQPLKIVNKIPMFSTDPNRKQNDDSVKYRGFFITILNGCIINWYDWEETFIKTTSL